MITILAIWLMIIFLIIAPLTFLTITRELNRPYRQSPPPQPPGSD